METAKEMEEYINFEVNLKLEIFVFVISTLIGFLHRNIANVKMRKWTWTIAGVALHACTIPKHLWHLSLLCSLIIAIIKLVDHRKVYLYVTFTALSYMVIITHLYYEELRGEMLTFSVISMTFTANVIGLSYDIYLTKKAKFDGHNLEYETNPGIMDIVHFLSFHIGISFRYRTYDDFINKPFARNSPYFHEIVKGFIKLSVAVCLGQVFETYAPFKFIVTTEFRSRSFCYKIFYTVLQYLYFVNIMQNLYFKAEIICIAFGIGVYPVVCASKPSYGPMKRYKELSKISEEQFCVYDYETIRSVNIWEFNTTPWMSIATRNWNMTHRYWLMSVHNTITASPEYKKFSVIATFMTSTLWHTNHQTCAIAAMLVAIYIMCNKNYWKLSSHLTGWTSLIYLFILWAIRMIYYPIMVTVFSISDFHHAVNYLKSIYFFPLITLPVYYIVGKILYSRHVNKLNLKSK